MENIKKETVTPKHLLSHESLESFFIQSSAVILASVPKLPSEITKEPTINDCLDDQLTSGAIVTPFFCMKTNFSKIVEKPL